MSVLRKEADMVPLYLTRVHNSQVVNQLEKMFAIEHKTLI
jgi:hypothetical protein